MKLTATFCRQAIEPKRYADGGGLYLQIARSGRKNWLFRTKSSWITIGEYPTLGLAEARKRAAEVRDGIRLGRLGISAVSDVPSFKDVTAAFIERKASGWKNAKTSYIWNHRLETYAFPFIGEKPVDQIATADVERLLENIWVTKTETASDVRSKIENVLDFAFTRHSIEKRNPARWKGNLEHQFVSPKRQTPVEHHPVFPVSVHETD